MAQLDDSRVNNPDWIREKYHGECLSQSEIAELVGCSRGVIRNRMEKFDIERRSQNGPNKPLQERFWSRVDKDPDECWQWMGSTKNGYPEIVVNGETKYGHRLAYELQHDEQPGDMQVNHHCDNRTCVRGDHLYLGTQTENVADQVERDRMARGEDRGSAKLSRSEVREIREKYQSGNHLQRELAVEYDVTRGAIGNVVRGDTWDHLEDK